MVDDPSSGGRADPGEHQHGQGAPPGGQYPPYQEQPQPGQYPPYQQPPQPGQYPPYQQPPQPGQYPPYQQPPQPGQYPPYQEQPQPGQYPPYQQPPQPGQNPYEQGYGYPPQGAYGSQGQYGAPGGYGQPPGYGLPNYGSYPQGEGAGGGPTDAYGRSLATWGRRAAAIVIDWVVLGIPGIIIIAVLAGMMGSGSKGSGVVVGYLVLLVGSFLYFGTLYGSENGQTLGMRAMGIAVRDVNNGGAIGVGRGILRFLIFFLFGLLGIVSLVNILWPLWDSRRQAIHDKVASTCVIALPR